MLVKELIDTLAKNYKPEDHIAAHLWAVDDVMSAAKEIEVTITTSDACIIIDNVHNEIDSEYGITWETIDTAIEKYIEGDDNG